jgi:hypothetical protein
MIRSERIVFDRSLTDDRRPRLFCHVANDQMVNKRSQSKQGRNLYRLDHAKALFIVLSLTVLGGIKIDKNGSVANVETWNEFLR